MGTTSTVRLKANNIQNPCGIDAVVVSGLLANIINLSHTNVPWNKSQGYMGGCQNYGPFLGTLNIRCRIIIRIQKWDHNLTIYMTSTISPEPGITEHGG